MANPKVAVVVPSDRGGDSYREMEAAGCNVELADESWSTGFNATEEAYLSLCADADAVIGGRLEGLLITRDRLSQLKNLRIYCRYNIGYDDIDLEAATDLGIIVTNSPVESNWGSVAENAFALMLCLLKRIPERDRHVREGGWRQDEPSAQYIGRRLDGYEGLTVGLIGLGRVGSRMADLLQPWRVKLLACDPYVDQSKFVHHNTIPVDMKTLLQESDVVSLHCDLNGETRQMINQKQFGLMKPTAIFLNTARGGLVDYDALFNALDKDVIAGAGLDVFEIEPLPKQSPILDLGNKVVLTPHSAGRTPGGINRNAVVLQTEILLTALRGVVPKCVVNTEVLPKWRERFGDKCLI
ncbi:MAG TPA: hypothetical protein EYO32_13640 [Rhodospirillales bacterium]|nr:hypothetical protein [Rhodospirillales bacterium]